MLEKMSEFFENRLDGYDEHMLTNIEYARDFYPFTAELLPKNGGCKILDLGCGTGLELEFYFALNPEACVTGIDLSQGMLDALSAKLDVKNITLICDSYFDAPFGENIFDAALSVESLHHFTQKEKIPLYEKLCKAIKDGGYFVLTDYFALSDEEEQRHRDSLTELKKEQGITDGEFYHYDTPLTVEHEIEALTSAGFSSVDVLKSWGATYCLVAKKV
jgi:tRNA (cmo5U34)-methyltransferase